jgi:hypothetical protein
VCLLHTKQPRRGPRALGETDWTLDSPIAHWLPSRLRKKSMALESMPANALLGANVVNTQEAGWLRGFDGWWCVERCQQQ